MAWRWRNGSSSWRRWIWERVKRSVSTAPPAGSATSYVNGPLAVEFNVAVATARTYAIGKSPTFRPLTLKAVNTGGVSRTYTSEVINSPSGGTPLAPLSVLDPARYWTVSNTANLNPTARINLTYGGDDNVLSQPSARIAQSSTSSGTQRRSHALRAGAACGCGATSSDFGASR